MGFKSIALAATTLVLSNSAIAAPMYYTFSGNVNWITDGAGIISDGSNTFTFGAPVSYVWEVDYETPGYSRLGNGDEVSTGHFYTRLLSGAMLDPSDIGLPFDPETSTLDYYGVYGGGNGTFSNQQDNRHLVQIYNLGDVLSLSVDDGGFSVYETVISVDGTASRYQVLNTLTLTAISETSPVPLPAALWLFGTGLLGLVGVARRKKA